MDQSSRLTDWHEVGLLLLNSYMSPKYDGKDGMPPGKATQVDMANRNEASFLSQLLLLTPFLVPCSLNRVLSISVGRSGSGGGSGILLNNSIDFVRKTVVLKALIMRRICIQNVYKLHKNLYTNSRQFVNKLNTIWLIEREEL